MQYYSYISSIANWDCTPTYFLCAPSAYAKDKNELERFAVESGWVAQAEKNAAVLVAFVTDDYNNCSLSLIPEFYDLHKNDFKAPGGVSIPGRDGVVWLWETMIYLIGYEDGADYAANVLTKEPGFFAASALFDGRITDYSHCEEEASHWFVRKPKDYKRKNKEIASAVWLFNRDKDIDATVDYFQKAGSCNKQETRVIGSIETEVSYPADHPAAEIRVSAFNSKVTADIVAENFFDHILRWKNSPDGELRNYLGKHDYGTTDEFIPGEVTVNGLTYDYTVHLPKGKNAEGLPLVFNIHGRGEPGWVYAEKNGWDKLADETGEFMVVTPGSPLNIWQIVRDKDSLIAILEDVRKKYKYDETRVYLNGFSNGAIFTCQQATTFPQIFAAASPWNGPDMEFCQKIGLDAYYFHPEFQESGYEVPFWIVVGDADSKAKAEREAELEVLLPTLGCKRDRYEEWNGENCYLKEKGFSEGERFTTQVFRNDEGKIRLGYTVMKNMPHGAIWDESRAAWNFMKRFRRCADNKEVVEEE